MAHVFISYKREDADFAFEMKRQIERQNFQTWIDDDKLRAGEDWREAIDEAIVRDAFALIVIMTPEARSSEYVTYEWSCARGANVTVIPVVLEATELHPRLAGLQYLDFTLPPYPWEKLIERLDEIQRQNGVLMRLPRNTPSDLRQAVEALNSWNMIERRQAIEHIAQSSYPGAYDIMISALQHIQDDVKLEVLSRLLAREGFNDERALPALERMLESDNGTLFLQAITGLGMIGNKAAVAKLRELLYMDDEALKSKTYQSGSDGNSFDPDDNFWKDLGILEPQFRETLINALLGAGKRGLYVLYEYLNQRGGEALEQQQASIVNNLLAKRDMNAVSMLLKHENPSIRYKAAEALWRNADKFTQSCLYLLLPMVKDPDKTIKLRTIGTVMRLRDSLHIPANQIIALLVAIIGDADPDVTIAAIQALGDFSADAELAVPKLAEILAAEPDPSNKSFKIPAKAALEKIGTPEAKKALRRAKMPRIITSLLNSH